MNFTTALYNLSLALGATLRAKSWTGFGGKGSIDGMAARARKNGDKRRYGAWHTAFDGDDYMRHDEYRLGSIGGEMCSSCDCSL